MMAYLSVWEVGHRWEGVDPDTPCAGDVRLKVRDRLRQLLHALRSMLNAYDVHGEIIPMEMLWFGLPKTKTAKQLDKAVHDPFGHKELLLAVFVSQTEVLKWSARVDQDLPEFWSQAGDFEWHWELRGGPPAPQVTPAKLRPDQEDKARCQEIARRLWKEHSDMTIAEMTRRREILVDGNGKAYKGKNTLRNWLKEVAPAPVRKRRGRPRKV